MDTENKESASIDKLHKEINLFNNCNFPIEKKFEYPAAFLSRQWFARTSVLMDIFKKTSGVSGSIVECGTYYGNFTFTMAKLAAAFEPYNYRCKIISFDTFEGNKGYNEQKDILPKAANEKAQAEFKEGGWKADVYKDLQEAVRIFDEDRPLNKFEKIEIIKGDVSETVPKYLKDNPNLIIRILNLSINYYEPTKVILKTFLPRMAKGSIITLTNLNYAFGTTQALLEELNIKDYQLITPPEYPNINYIIL